MDLIDTMPEDIINHIAKFYITKKIKLQCRLDKLYKKVEKMEKRTINEWIEYLKFSKRYSIKNIEIINDKINYINQWGDKLTCNKSEIIDQGSIKHVRSLYRWYRQIIITESTPDPQYEGEIFINIVGEKMIAEFRQYGDHGNYTGYGGDEDDECNENYIHRCLVFTRVIK